MNQPIPGTSEAILFALRSLYIKHGYSLYKMNKFEEYDLYAHNKDFLISDNVITFTDGSGKLLALKPDVTLSIVKNSKDRGASLQKLCYNENVYRPVKSSRNFREIMQVGLECIGDVDGYATYEVIKLALESLELISPDCVLNISHLGMIWEVFDYIKVPSGIRADLLRLIGEKNTHELTALLRENSVGDEKIDLIKELLKIRGGTAEVLERIKALLTGVVSARTLDGFCAVLSPLSDFGALCVDFSVVGDTHYYNGFVFKGYVNGIPNSLLSGGQYDMLMKKMGRSSRAIGFAVYLDMVEELSRNTEKYDVDILLLYDAGESIAAIGKVVGDLRDGGESVLAEKCDPGNIKYKKLLRLKNGRVEIIENNA